MCARATLSLSRATLLFAALCCALSGTAADNVSAVFGACARLLVVRPLAHTGLRQRRTRRGSARSRRRALAPSRRSQTTARRCCLAACFRAARLQHPTCGSTTQARCAEPHSRLAARAEQHRLSSARQVGVPVRQRVTGVAAAAHRAYGDVFTGQAGGLWRQRRSRPAVAQRLGL